MSIERRRGLSTSALRHLVIGKWSRAMMRKIEQPGLLEVLDRILDKGIVIDAWLRFSPAGMDFLTVEARIVVASLETYLEYAGAIRNTPLRSAPLQRAQVITINTPRSGFKAIRKISDL
jgi:gas vesicle structural protein